MGAQWRSGEVVFTSVLPGSGTECTHCSCRTDGHQGKWGTARQCTGRPEQGKSITSIDMSAGFRMKHHWGNYWDIYETSAASSWWWCVEVKTQTWELKVYFCIWKWIRYYSYCCSVVITFLSNPSTHWLTNPDSGLQMMHMEDVG